MTFTTIRDIVNWVDSATANWDGRTEFQVNYIADYIRAHVDYGRDASDFMSTLPDNLADILPE